MTLTRSLTRPRTLAGLAVAALAAGGLAAGPAAAAEGQIRSPENGTVVADSYVVVLKNTTTLRQRGVGRTVDGLSGRYGGRIGRTYQHAVRGFEVSLSEAAAKRLAADPAVSYVERNALYTIQDTQSNPPWGLNRIDQRTLPLNSAYSYTGNASNVTAYVVDTGIRFSHREFGGRATSGRDFVNNDNDASDCQGHGTHVAGTIGGATYGVAKGVRLVGVRVLNCQGSGTTAQIVGGVDWVTANARKPAVVNMSLGGGVNSTIDNAVRNSIASGITYAIAAGNGNSRGVPQDACSTSPARVPQAITVSATQSNDARASFGNYGTCVDIFAPGVSVASAWYTNDTATNTISGTSMATPHVAGVAALYLSANPSAAPATVASALVSAATPNVVGNPGSGTPNRLLYSPPTGWGGGGTGPTPTPTTTTPPPAGTCSGTNGTDVAIPDAGAAVASAITISGCARTPGTAQVQVDIVHPDRGDIAVELVAPNGTVYRLKSSSIFGSGQNLQTTYSVNVGGAPANGAWQLRVRDAYLRDTGTLNAWGLTL